MIISRKIVLALSGQRKLDSWYALHTKKTKQFFLMSGR